VHKILQQMLPFAVAPFEEGLVHTVDDVVPSVVVHTAVVHTAVVVAAAAAAAAVDNAFVGDKRGDTATAANKDDTAVVADDENTVEVARLSFAVVVVVAA